MEVTIEHTSRGLPGLAGLLILALAGGIWFGLRAPQAPPAGDDGAVEHVPLQSAGEAPDAPTPAGTITVHVSGAVASPGLVEVAATGRVADAIAAAGGAGPTANLSLLNLAAPIREGEQITVPARGDRRPAGGGGGNDASVAINVADATELQRLPGVGPVLATRIVDHRSEHGPFTTPEDLLDVPGIGEAKLAAMRDRIAVP